MPGFNINNFLSHINQSGVLVANKFLVNFNAPQGLVIAETRSINSTVVNYSREMNDLITFRADSVTAPGVTLDTANIYKLGIGPSEKKPFNARFNDIRVSFLVDKNADLYTFFYTWINYIFNYSGSQINSVNQNTRTTGVASYTSAYKNTYETDIEIVMFDESGEFPVQVFRLKKAYPVMISDINLSWSAKSTLIKLDVMFTFKDWTLDNVVSNLKQID